MGLRTMGLIKITIFTLTSKLCILWFKLQLMAMTSLIRKKNYYCYTVDNTENQAAIKRLRSPVISSEMV